MVLVKGNYGDIVSILLVKPTLDTKINGHEHVKFFANLIA